LALLALMVAIAVAYVALDYVGPLDRIARELLRGP
jgi:hypothetical protein